MTETTGAFFEALGQRGHEPLLEKISGSVRFEIVDGKRVERWLLTVDKGDVAVSRKNVRADCTLRADKDLFRRVTRGEVNAMAATLRGDIVLDGRFRAPRPVPAASSRAATASPAASRHLCRPTNMSDG